MSCRGKAIHALGECDCYFKPRDFLEFLEKERRWFELLDTLRHLRWQRMSPEDSPEGQAVILMLRHRAGTYETDGRRDPSHRAVALRFPRAVQNDELQSQGDDTSALGRCRRPPHPAT